MSQFAAYLAALQPDAEDYAAGRRLAAALLPALREHFGGDEHLVAGSFGKRNAIRPLPPVDLYVLLPDELAEPQAAREETAMALGLGPSALADGWRVMVPMPGGLVAVAPCLRRGGAFLVPDPQGGWRVSNPAAEVAAFHLADQLHGGRVHQLLALVKAWLRHAGVPLRGFAAEMLVRDYFAAEAPPPDVGGLFAGFLAWARRSTPCEITLPGGLARLTVDAAWHGHGEAAYWRCVLAERRAAAGEWDAATEEWRHLLGPEFPNPSETLPRLPGNP